jgi:hypothetical protein
MTVTETPAKRPFVWPAEYYSSGSPKPVLPAWAPFGCGAAAVVVLLVVFIGGALVTSGGLAEFMDMAVGMSVAEMKGQYAADVSAARKQSLDAEITLLRANLSEEKITIPQLQPFFELLRNASADKKVTAPEAANLEAAARMINGHAKRAAAAKAVRTDTTTGH